MLTLSNGKQYEIISSGPFHSAADQTSGVLLAFKSDLTNKNDVKAACVELMAALAHDLQDTEIENAIVRGQHSEGGDAGSPIRRTEFEGYSFQRFKDRWILVPAASLPPTYSNNYLGFAIEKPENWWFHWVTEEEPNQVALSAQRLQELQRMAVIGNHLSITYQKEPRDGLNPTLNVSVSKASVDADTYLNAVLASLSNPKTITSEAKVVHGHQAQSVVAEFDAMYHDQSVRMYARLRAVRATDRLFFISAFYAVDMDNLEQIEADLIKSIESFRLLDDI